MTKEQLHRIKIVRRQYIEMIDSFLLEDSYEGDMVLAIVDHVNKLNTYIEGCERVGKEKEAKIDELSIKIDSCEGAIYRHKYKLEEDLDRTTQEASILRIKTLKECIDRYQEELKELYAE